MTDYRAIVDAIRGPLVPIITAFTEDEELDIESTCKHVNWLIENGIPLIWLTGGTSRYFSMSDAEVWDLTKAVAEVTKGRALFFAATNYHWPVGLSRRYIQDAAGWGADIVTVQTWYSGKDDLIYDFHKKVAEDSPLPLFTYSAALPGVSSGISTALLERILDLPQYVGMKNDIGDFYEHRAYLWTIRQHGAKFTAMTGGSMMSFLWGYDFGAQAFTSGYGIVAPSVPLQFYDHLTRGRRDEALRIVKDYEETMMAAFADIGGWAALKTSLVFRGLYKTWKERFPFPTLTDEQAERVRVHLSEKGLL